MGGNTNSNSNSNGNSSNLSSAPPQCNGNIAVPYEALLKLVLAATNKVQTQTSAVSAQIQQIHQPTTQSNHAMAMSMHPPATPPPQHFQYSYHPNHQTNNHLNHRVHHEKPQPLQPQQAQQQRGDDLDCNSTLHFSDC